MKLNNPRSYTAVVGGILFALGLLGFAFRASFDLPAKYLFCSLILGFWGLVISAGNGKNN